MNTTIAMNKDRLQELMRSLQMLNTTAYLTEKCIVTFKQTSSVWQQGRRLRERDTKLLRGQLLALRAIAARRGPPGIGWW